MALMRFFKPPPHQRYVYKPRFWDPIKDGVKERIDKNTDPEVIKSRLSDHFSSRLSRGRVETGYRAKEVSRSNFRLILVLVVIIILTYLAFLTLPRFMVLFE
jgi:hypothetical protein